MRRDPSLHLGERLGMSRRPQAPARAQPRIARRLLSSRVEEIPEAGAPMHRRGSVGVDVLPATGQALQPAVLPRGAEQGVALEGALTFFDPELAVVLDEQPRRQRVGDRLVRGELHRQLHDLGISTAVQARVREMTEDHVAQLVVEDPGEVLGVLLEILEVHQELQSPVGRIPSAERHGHHLDLGGRHGIEARQETHVARVVSDEIAAAEPVLEPPATQQARVRRASFLALPDAPQPVHVRVTMRRANDAGRSRTGRSPRPLRAALGESRGTRSASRAAHARRAGRDERGLRRPTWRA